MPRFVILYHELPPESPRATHWDLMLQSGPTLRTWALAEPPQAAATIAAEELPPHRLEYLDYEGPVSGARGKVARWDAGDYALPADSPDAVRVRLAGQRCRGELLLLREGNAWSAVWQPDRAGPAGGARSDTTPSGNE